MRLILLIIALSLVGNMEKDKSLEGLRGLAAMIVVLAHVFYAYFPYMTTRREPNPSIEPKTLLDYVLHMMPFNALFIADAAVILFFVLSGYVLTIKFFAHRDVKEIQSAAVRRYIRLMFPAAVSVFFAWSILSMGLMTNHLVGVLDVSGWPIEYYQEQRSIWSALISAILYVPFFGDTYFNGPLWSIQVEFLGSMLLFASFALFGRSSLVLTCLFFLYVAKMFTGLNPGVLYYIAILAGAMLHPATNFLKRNSWLSVILFIVGFVLITVDKSSQYSWLVSLPVPNLEPVLANLKGSEILFWQTVGSIMVVAGTVGSRHVSSVLGSKVPAYLGRISYASYLLHLPLMMSLMFGSMYALKLAGARYLVQIVGSFTIYVMVLLILSELFTRYVDRRAIKLGWQFDNWLHRK